MTKSIKSLIHKFYLLRECLNKNLLITIYKSLVESVIRYGILVWGGTYKKAINPLCTIQNTILKIIFKENKLYHTDLIYTENLLNIRSLYILTVCKFMIKNFSNNYSHITHKFNTRNKISENIPIPCNKTTLNLKSISYLGPKIYNKIPQELRQIKSKKLFNKKCSKFIFDSYNHTFADLF